MDFDEWFKALEYQWHIEGGGALGERDKKDWEEYYSEGYSAYDAIRQAEADGAWL